MFDSFFIEYSYLAKQKLIQLQEEISSQSKENFLLEQDVRFLDSRIALLIHHQKELDEVLMIILFCINLSNFPVDWKMLGLKLLILLLMKTRNRAMEI